MRYCMDVVRKQGNMTFGQVCNTLSALWTPSGSVAQQASFPDVDGSVAATSLKLQENIPNSLGSLAGVLGAT